MNFRLFLDELLAHWNSGLPFVAFRKPNEKVVKALLQDSNKLNFIKDFNESGFVMAPFDSSKEALIFSFEQCKLIQSEFIPSGEISKKEEITTENNESTNNSHINLVENGIKAIQSGALSKVVLSRKEKVPVTQSSFDIFQKLLETYPTAFVYIWYHPMVGTWLGATPETLLKIENNRFSTMALAGTQVYKGTLEVAWGSKEIEEQKIVTSFISENLRDKTESLLVSDLETVKAGNLLHLRTIISGTLSRKSNDHDLESIIFSLHPTPAVCGFPRDKAKEFILENENYNREYYTGFLGELNLTETKSRNSNRKNVENNAYATVKKVSNLYVNLRCMKLDQEFATLYVGGGITKDSVPEDEWNETINKTKTMKRAL